MLSPEAKQAVATELKRIAGDLNLSDDQKSKLQTALENAREKIDEIRQTNPDLTRADVIAKLKSVRGTARERLVQLSDAGAARQMGHRNGQGQELPGHQLLGHRKRRSPIPCEGA